MSITPSLRAASRSAYRNLWRASSSTFAGDEPTLAGVLPSFLVVRSARIFIFSRIAWRLKMRRDARAAEADGDPKVYESKITLAYEIADVLQKNIAQARKQGDSNIWRLRMTDKTELGDNSTIKNPPPMQTRRGSRTK
jgi:peptide chain release factor